MDEDEPLEASPAASLIRLHHIELGLDEDLGLLRGRAAEMLGIRDEQIASIEVARRSVDARDKRRIHFVYAVDVRLKDAVAIPPHLTDASIVLPEEPLELRVGSVEVRGRVVVVGAGPCGLFATLILAENGYAPLLIERGKPVAERVPDVQALFSSGMLDPESNVLFGEGGAGTFSDGKLYTRIRSAHTTKVLRTLIDCGAPADIAYDAWPHVGSDLLPGVVAALHRRLAELGAEIRFGARLEGVEQADGRLRALHASGERVETNAAMLAVGHSARDVFAMLLGSAVTLEPKDFQMGLRAEMPQELVDEAVYGRTPRHPRLSAAHYQLTTRSTSDTRAAFTFCMCPGGIVIPATNDADLLCTNGMSRRAQDGTMANCAIVVPVGIGDFAGSGLLAGVEWQRHWERIGFELGGGAFVAPAQRASDYLAGRVTSEPVRSSYPRGVRPADLAACLPEPVAKAIAAALRSFDERIPGFASERCVLLGPESRCSSPVRIVRHADTLQSVSTAGLYPAGEGAGYSGGIVSSAVDGIRAAEALIASFARPGSAQGSS